MNVQRHLEKSSCGVLINLTSNSRISYKVKQINSGSIKQVIKFYEKDSRDSLPSTLRSLSIKISYYEE